MRAVWIILAVFLVLMMLAGCAHAPPPSPPRATAVCDALIGPIKYNSHNIKSRRHAGPALAPDLKRRNQVGENLRCPQFR